MITYDDFDELLSVTGVLRAFSLWLLRRDRHSGVEAVYVIEGEACYETPTRGFTLRKGETLAIPGDTSMRAVVPGSTRRHVLAVIVHDASQPPTMRMEEGKGPQLVPCT